MLGSTYEAANVNDFFQITDDSKVRNRIVSTVEIASKCGQALSVSEIALLLPYELELANIREIIQSDPQVSVSLSMENDLAVQKGYEHLFSEKTFRQGVSKKYLEVAKMFAEQLIHRSSHVKLMAVCGSVAYGSAVSSDDIDLFLITKKNRMWLPFFKALLLARVFRIKAATKGEKADYCLSYVQDEKYFEEEITRQRAPLFAREFLSMRILAGTNYYATLLNRTNWMRQMFPRLHASKVMEQSHNEISRSESQHISKVNDILNLFTYVILRGYLSFKAFLRNLKYRKQHKIRDVFEATISRVSFVFTSERYRELEKMYNCLVR
jgi:predicted nucleotidyltransferase